LSAVNVAMRTVSAGSAVSLLLLALGATSLRVSQKAKPEGKPKLSIRIQPSAEAKGGLKFPVSNINKEATKVTAATAEKAKPASTKGEATKTKAKPKKTKKDVVPHAAFQHSAPCFDLNPGEGVQVQMQKQKFGTGGYLLSLPPGSADPEGEKALMSTYEALLDDCKSSKHWLVDAGAGTGQVSALAASVGCKVAAFDPDVKDVHALTMSHCLNHWTQTFAVFPTMAAATPGGNLTIIPGGETRPGHSVTNATNATGNATEMVIHGVTLDGVMVGGSERQYSLDANTTSTEGWDDKIALLKITPQECCTTDTTGKALSGARELLNSGRVQCMALELGFDKSTPDVIATLELLEVGGYKLAHTGPMGSTLEISKSGTYVLYSTSATQLREVDEALKRIRSFDERSGIRAYGNGLSLNRDGQYFEYGELVVACRQAFPEKLEVRQPGRIRFGGGMWWLDDVNTTNVTKSA